MSIAGLLASRPFGSAEYYSTMLFDNAAKLIQPDGMSDDEARVALAGLGFADWRKARVRFAEICDDDACRDALAECLPMLLVSLSDAATPDGSLINFERFVQSVEDRTALFRYLASNPRAVEILVKLFVGSQFLTEILLRNPGYLDKLTQHKRLAEFKSRQDFVEEARAAANVVGSLRDRTVGSRSDPTTIIDEKLDALRRFQQWELLRIGACDSFGLLDLKSTTVQLSLLADSLVQVCLGLLAEELSVSPEGFVVLAFGKLGGEELNYSSDIDLVFLADSDATKFWTLGQRLIKALTQSTGEGFLYRVDMRLRPWGRSGALVNTVDAHIGYLKKHGRPWEKQALVKARPIAGDLGVGAAFLKRAEPLIYGMPADLVRDNIREMKRRIEAELDRKGQKWGEVKSGEGSIRDIEFVTQCLQLTCGGDVPAVRSINTLDGLVRLADFGLIQADEYRHLSSAYVFLRTIEHALQLMHHKQTHLLPDDRRELAYLARRLDYPDAGTFLEHYRQHCEAVRAVFDKYISEKAGGWRPAGTIEGLPVPAAARFPDHRALMEPSYAETFSDEEIARHAALLKKLSDENLVEVEAERLENGRWRVTIVGYNYIGELSLMCGLLFVYGFNIIDGNVFTAEQVASQRSEARSQKSEVSGHPFKARGPRPAGADGLPATDRGPARQFVDVFTVVPPLGDVLPEVWTRYKHDLLELIRFLRDGTQREAQGQLARRVAGALRDAPERPVALYPVEVEIDNAASEQCTVLHIRSEDTIGFLYELTNALALSGIEVERVIVSSIGNRVFDTLYVTTADGEKISDENRLRELRAAVVLIKHFTHLLPRSPNPEQSLLHFRDFLEQLFRQPNWIEEFQSLERSEVLDALARLLGVSNFLWEDFLRLQHANLFPVVTDVEALAERKSKQQLEAELDAELAAAATPPLNKGGPGGVRNTPGVQPPLTPPYQAGADPRREKLNAFKDREMFRVDMRHILGHIAEFGQFSHELTDIADVVVAAAYRICEEALRSRYGAPQLPAAEASGRREPPGSPVRRREPPDSPAGSRRPLAGRDHFDTRNAQETSHDEHGSRPCPLAVCALGKFGGRELGFASDIELMFIFEADGRTTGPEVITTTEFFVKLVEAFMQTIRARQEGIFQIDLRLRPYGRAGSLAVSLDAFRTYFAPDGPAWPYERQALVKLRPVAGDEEFGRRIVELRDELIYADGRFDVAAMRAMREKQVRQLVQAGTFNAKLSTGGLVDCEYLVQGLQIAHGHKDPKLRARGTREAMAALNETGILSDDDHARLLEAYIFLRRLIDALRVVRGNAKDLAVPPADSEEFDFLARRLGYGGHVERLKSDLDRHTADVQDLGRLLDGAVGTSVAGSATGREADAER